MAAGKKSFVLYTSYVHAINLLSNEQAGKLLKHIFNYVNDLDPQEDDVLVRVAFEPIKQQLKRDLIEWKSERKRRSAAGKKGMETRWKKTITKDNTTITDDSSVIIPITKITDNVNVDVNVNENVNVDVVRKRERAFAPPSKEDVSNFFLDKLDEFTAMAEAEKFINFYESKNWFVGKNKMKDWNAAARGWISRMNEFKKEVNGTHKQTFSSSKPGTADDQNAAVSKW